jgi:hypothetical protein
VRLVSLPAVLLSLARALGVGRFPNRRERLSCPASESHEEILDAQIEELTCRKQWHKLWHNEQIQQHV